MRGGRGKVDTGHTLRTGLQAGLRAREHLRRDLHGPIVPQKLATAFQSALAWLSLISSWPSSDHNHFSRASSSFTPDPHSLLCCRPMIELCIPSSLDPTLAPPGCHVVSLFTQYTPYTLAGGKAWDEQEKKTYADKGKERIGCPEWQPGMWPDLSSCLYSG